MYDTDLDSHILGYRLDARIVNTFIDCQIYIFQLFFRVTY